MYVYTIYSQAYLLQKTVLNKMIYTLPGGAMWDSGLLIIGRCRTTVHGILRKFILRHHHSYTTYKNGKTCYFLPMVKHSSSDLNQSFFHKHSKVLCSFLFDQHVKFVEQNIETINFKYNQFQQNILLAYN